MSCKVCVWIFLQGSSTLLMNTILLHYPSCTRASSTDQSDGTFTSDFTHYLDKIKAKDFVEWLASTKREG
uniref:Glucagon / GIP / secretin / VIP family domain-containing protein n=1 Tax=Seriola lalandi dorsalis TaxID=1841481 RepID=A0A3B4WUT4_SERLL